MNMIFLELKKILKNKILYVFAVLFIILNIYKINIVFESQGKENNDFNNAYYKIYYQVKGEMTSDKISFIVGEYKRTSEAVKSGNYSTEPNQPGTYTGYIFGDMGMFMELFNQMDYAYNYKTRTQDVITKAKDNIIFFTNKNNEYEVRNNKQIVKIYDNRKIDTFYDTSGFKNLINYDFSSLLIIMLLMLGLVPVFSGEKASGMNIILKTTKVGTNKIVKLKLLASYIYTFIISLLFSLVDIITYAILFGFDGGTNSIYSINQFVFTPLTIKIWQYLILAFFLRFLCFLFITCMILFFSSLFSDNVFPLITATAFIFIMLFINDFIYGKAGKIISTFNPVSLLTTRDLFERYNVVNIFNYPIFKVIPIIIVCVLAFFCMTLLTLLFSNRLMVSNNNYFKALKNKIKELFGVV